MVTHTRTCSHAHLFAAGQQQDGSRRTRIVLGLTVLTMGGEILAGHVFGSMALLADGWHMSTHACALAIAVWAYAFQERHAHNPRFTFGTGKIPSLAAFFSAVLLGFVALGMVWESAQRLLTPRDIIFDQALLVAVLGLVVNLLSAWLLHDGPDHHHHDHHHHEHEHDHAHEGGGHVRPHHRDQNLHAAYVHVLADAVTSVLAIAALLLGKYLGWFWLDPAMGIVGAVVISRWAWGLMCQSGAVLVDYQADDGVERRIRHYLQSEPDAAITDLHVWHMAPGHWGVILALASPHGYGPTHYKQLLASIPELSHISVEIDTLASVQNNRMP